MPERIRGITVEIGGDTSDLSKALKSSNKEIKNTQSQLKDVDKLLKLDPGNIDLLRQREKLLNDAVKETGDKLEDLKAIQRNMDANGVDRNSAQYMALQREIISTGADLEDLERAARDSNAALSAVGAVAEKAAAKANKLASATAGVSAAAAGVLTALVKAGYDVVTKSDDLNTAAAQTGFDTGTIQAFEYASDRIDVSFETISGAARKMKTNIFNGSKEARKSFKKLGVATKNVDGTFRSTDEVFMDTVAALGRIEDPVLRDKYAMSIFGKSADELAGLLDDGGEAFSNYAQEAEDLGLILDQETLDGLNAVNDEIDKLKAMFRATWAKTGAKIIQKLTPVFQRLAEKIEQAVEWVANLSDEQLWGFVKILGGVALLSPALKVIGGLATSIVSVTKAAKALKALKAAKALKSLKTGISAVNAVLMANPILLIIAAIAALIVICVKFKDQIIGALSKVGEWLHSKLERDWREVFGNTLGGILNFFSKGVLKAWDRIQNTVSDTVSIIHGIFTGDWKEVWSTASKAVKRGVDKARKNLGSFDGWMNKTFTTDWTDKFGNRIGGWMNKASDKILTGWNGKVKPGLDKALDWLDDTFSGDWDHAWSNIKQLGSDVWDGVKNGWDNTLKPALSKANTWMKETFGIDFGSVWDSVKTAATGAWSGIKDGWEKDGLKGALDGAVTWIDETFGTSWSSKWEAIRTAGTDAWDKIRSGWEENGLLGALDGAKTWISETFFPDWDEKWSAIKEAGADAWSSIRSGWEENGLQGALEGARTWISQTFGADWATAWGDVKTKATNAWENIKNGWSAEGGLKAKLISAKDWLSGTFSKDWSSAWESVKGTEAFTAISDGWETLKKTLSDAWTWLKDTFSVDWSSVWTDITDDFGEIWGTVGTACKAPLNACIGFINSMIDKINGLITNINSWNLPFVGSINIGTIPKIPLLAKGGTLLNGSAIVGEAGPELLTVRNGRTTVLPLTGQEKNGSAANITINTQQMTEAQVDYLINRINRGLGARV